MTLFFSFPALMTWQLASRSFEQLNRFKVGKNSMGELIGVVLVVIQRTVLTLLSFLGVNALLAIRTFLYLSGWEYCCNLKSQITVPQGEACKYSFVSSIITLFNNTYFIKLRLNLPFPKRAKYVKNLATFLERR